MAQELVQEKDTHPVIQPSAPRSAARGFESIAKVLGGIAERSTAKAGDYASEASKTNLLQTKSMLDDISSKSKLEMLRSPEHASAIAKNAEQTAEKIKSVARLNRQDRVNLDLAAKDTVRDLSFKAQEKSIQMTNEAAKYSTLSAFNSTLKDISNTIFTNPESAEKTIQAQYESLSGQVRSGILTAVEAANLHKQLEHEVDRAAIILQGYKNENLTASDVNALHAASPNPQPFSNSNLPMAHDTTFHADNHLSYLNTQDIKSKWATGNYVAPQQLTGVKKTDTLQSLLIYKNGTSQAAGDIFSGVSWNTLKKRLDVLKKTNRLSTEQEGYKDRLNNYIVGIEKDNQYATYISQTPAGARAYLDYAEQQGVINGHAYFGDENQVATQRHLAASDNLNNLVSTINAIGIGTDTPDAYRQPVPIQYVAPVLEAFNAGGNVNAAINNIAQFNRQNRAYMANGVPDARKSMVIYETGQLFGRTENGFLLDFWHSQQDGPSINESANTSEPKFRQLQSDATGLSDKKLVDKINPRLAEINNYLQRQEGGGALVSSSTDKALRYVKFMAAKNGDVNFQHANDYIQTYADNMKKAYSVDSGFNYVMDSNVVPLDTAQKELLSAHAISETRKKLRRTMSDSQIDEYFSSNPPTVVTNALGRVQVINPAGNLISDGEGHAAFNEMYSEGVWRAAEHDEDARDYMAFSGKSNVFMRRDLGKAASRASGYFASTRLPEPIKPVEEGNIDVDHLPKVFNEKGEYHTVRTITIEEDGKTILIPTVVNGHVISHVAAIKHFHKTGEHLGKFGSEEEAQKYDKQLHERHGWTPGGTVNPTEPSSFSEENK